MEVSNYQAWQHQDLVKRVLELEQKLRERTQSHSQGTLLSRHSASKKVRKPPKPFDESRYSTRKIALKFAYLGAEYNGLEHQRDNPLPAIEYVLWKALRKTRLIFPRHRPGQSEDEVCWDGCEYSKCGRTDRGVSAFGQIIALRVRSARPVPRARVPEDEQEEGAALENGESKGDSNVESKEEPFDPVRDELPYIQLLNRVLPPEIRILAWCADLPPDFNARYSCRERRYRYFFTNPAYLPTPGSADQTDGWLDIEMMRIAARKYKGLHDFRNLCKIDPGKQITDFRRRIFHADIHAVGDEQTLKDGSPKLYYFEVRGSAFLWHQVRCLVAVLFLIGQGYEQPELVDKLLDVKLLPGRPVYDMASDVPLSLWDCIFPDLATSDHPTTDKNLDGYHDVLPWIHIGDEVGGRDTGKKALLQEGDGKYGYRGIMEELWSIWRKRKLDEVLVAQLMSLVAGQGHAPPSSFDAAQPRSDRVFEGAELPRTVGVYIPVMQRHRMEAPEIQNARYAARHGLNQEHQEESGD